MRHNWPVDALDAPDAPLLLPPFDAARAADRIHVHSTKYDGSPHYQYDGFLVDQGEGWLRIVVKAGTPFVSYRERGEVICDMTQIYFTDRWYNAFHNHQPLGRRGMLTYCNVGTPARLEGNTLRWVDLDLDVIQSQALGLFVDDEDEFQEHQRQMAYPPEVIRRAEAARNRLLALGRDLAFPFDREMHLPA